VKDIHTPTATQIDHEEELLAVMVEIGREINEILSLDELLEKIAQLTRRFVDYQIFAILLVDEESNDLFSDHDRLSDTIEGKHIKFGAWGRPPNAEKPFCRRCLEGLALHKRCGRGALRTCHSTRVS
jgi:hypothetical protein